MFLFGKISTILAYCNDQPCVQACCVQYTHALSGLDPRSGAEPFYIEGREKLAGGYEILWWGQDGSEGGANAPGSKPKSMSGKKSGAPSDQ